MGAAIRNFSFPLLVLVSLAWSAHLTASVEVPNRVPDFALQAAAIYRLEVGGASFLVLYLASMAFFLALDGRGFAELGMRGVRPTEVARAANEQEGTLTEQMMLIHNMGKTLASNKGLLDKAVGDLSALEQRLQRLEAGD